MTTQYSLRNLFFLITAISVGIFSELVAGLFSFFIDLIPFELSFLAGPLIVLAATLLFAIPRTEPIIDSTKANPNQKNIWVVACFCIATFGIAVSLLNRWESWGRFSGMANGIKFVRATMLESIIATASLAVLRFNRASAVGLRLVYVTMLLFVAPAVLMAILN